MSECACCSSCSRYSPSRSGIRAGTTAITQGRSFRSCIACSASETRYYPGSGRNGTSQERHSPENVVFLWNAEGRIAMKKWIILLAGTAAMTAFAPATSSAQIGIDVPGVGVRIGEPYRHRYEHDGWRYRERDVYLSRRGCRTVTVERDDGTVKRIRRCDD